MALRGNKKLKSSAEVVDKHLILSLPNAIEPIVWRMELNKIGTASFEIKPIKSSDAHKLVLKPKKGTAEPIAQFEDKETALTALLQASNAMQRPENNVQSLPSNAEMQNNGTPATSKNNNKSSNRWLYLFLGFLAVIGLYVYMVKQIPKTITNSEESTAASVSSDNKVPTGVPLSADDFLNGL